MISLPAPLTIAAMLASLLTRTGIVVLVAATLFSACSSTAMSADERERQITIHRDSCAGWLSMGEYQRARDQAERGLQLDGDDFVLNLYLGRALLNLGTVNDILRAEQVLSALDSSEDFRVSLSLGEVLERKGNAYEKGADRLRSGDQSTNDPDPQARADELHAMGQAAFEAARAQYLHAYSLEPGDTEVLNGLVRICALLGAYQDSLVWGETIIRITRDDRLFWQQQLDRPNIASREEEQVRRAIRDLEQLETAVHLQAATVLNNYLGDPAEALRHINAIVAFDPSIAEAYSRQAQLQVKLEMYEEAIAAIDNYLKRTTLDFDHPDIQRAYRLRTDCEAALARSDG